MRNLRWLQDRCKSDLAFIISRLETLAEESAARDADAARCLLVPARAQLEVRAKRRKALRAVLIARHCYAGALPCDGQGGGGARRRPARH